MQCIQPFVLDLQPGTALGYLQDVQYQLASVIEPDIAFLASNFSGLVVSPRHSLSHLLLLFICCVCGWLWMTCLLAFSTRCLVRSRVEDEQSHSGLKA